MGRRHLSYGITQCYMTSETGERARALPNPKAGTRLTCPGGTEGWVYLGGWLYTKTVYGNQSTPGVNRAWRRVTTLIETNALPLSQATNPLLADRTYM